MNHSIYTADRATHLKVVVCGLLISITIMAATLIARVAHPDDGMQVAASHTVYKPRPGHALTEMARTEKHPI